MTPDEDLARSRWMALMMLRLAGTVMAALGALMLASKIGASLGSNAQLVGAVLLVIGALDALFMPVYLARKWRGPK